MNTPIRTSNRLAYEKSPYLLQHARNPVDWYPWGTEAFEKAKREDKPVFLSIGYSTCHWCHVMERESFEDAEVAAVLNEHFVAVKVDREERPDIDQVYMEVCQALTGQGGWPLTILLTPDKKPFFAGTYFPKRSRGGLPGLLDLLEVVADRWARERPQFEEAGKSITLSLQRSRRAGRKQLLDSETLGSAYGYLSASFDPVYGGFGPAPKFPLPHQLVFLLRHSFLAGEERAREMAERTLEAMRLGGLWDHVGFGFHRYSADRRWLVPHFEKMLYDNALLAAAYLEAYQVTHNRTWAKVAEDVFTYILRDMTSPEGAFYSAEDADSEGVEGKFYLWTPQEVKDVLGRELGETYCRRYSITPEGNFEGKSIPNLISAGAGHGTPSSALLEEQAESALQEARVKLYEARQRRVHPFKDDKVLTAWNGLMIAALARGAAVLRKPAYATAAEQAAGFIQANLRRPDGRLLARYREGEAAYPAYLDDYAFLAWGLLELYQATLQPEHLKQALHLVQEMRDLFWDEAEGGFCFTGRDAEELLVRTKEVYDGALPSGNSVAALVLQRLSHLTGDEALAELGQLQLNAFAGKVQSHPAGHTFFLLALQWALGPVTQVVVAGSRDDQETEEMLRLLQERYLPLTTVVFRPTGAEADEIVGLVPALSERPARHGRATAYVCRQYACRAPVDTAEELAGLLD
ncbi:MAG: thioredoxin domain-containing protein [Betaproteobacteria bacterium]